MHKSIVQSGIDTSIQSYSSFGIGVEDGVTSVIFDRKRRRSFFERASAAALSAPGQDSDLLSGSHKGETPEKTYCHTILGCSLYYDSCVITSAADMAIPHLTTPNDAGNEDR